MLIKKKTHDINFDLLPEGDICKPFIFHHALIYNINSDNVSHASLVIKLYSTGEKL